MESPNADPEEILHFSSLAETWWQEDGPCRSLHDINPCRVDYIMGHGRLEGLRVADIGCGGGILSESMRHAGAEVCGIDASEDLIAVAKAHARSNVLDVRYEIMTSTELAQQEAATFDRVTCMELIEHVPDPVALLSDCARLLKPGGKLFLSTLNRSPKAYLFAILAAEYLLKVVPIGTHNYADFIRPSELADMGRQCGLDMTDISGMAYNPVSRRARPSRSVLVNYMATFVTSVDV